MKKYLTPTEREGKFWEIMETNCLDAEDVARLFLNWHGTQLLEDEFFEYIEREGFVVVS